jgi:hypothetical protein
MTEPAAVRRELLDNDRALKEQFAGELDSELNALSQALPICFGLVPALKEVNKEQTTRTALIAAFVFGVLDDIMVSTKLMSAGKLPAAGNLMSPNGRRHRHVRLVLNRRAADHRNKEEPAGDGALLGKGGERRSPHSGVSSTASA